jgi:hypothetical protein
MDFVLIAAGIGVAFALAAIASYLITRGIGTGRLVPVDIEDLDEIRVKPGQLLDIRADLQLLEFKGLETLPVLLLSSGGTEIQATVSDESLVGDILEPTGYEETMLLPGDIEGASGRRLELGSYRVIGQIEELPFRHVRIRGMAKN